MIQDNPKITQAAVKEEPPVASGDAPEGDRDVVNAQYDPGLLQLLGVIQDDLKKSHDVLLATCNDGQSLEVRPAFLNFKDTLKAYLSITSVQLYVYLRTCDKLDRRKKRIVAINEQESREATAAITRFVGRYMSPSAVYDEQFMMGLDSLWTIVNWRAYKERMELYPLYYATRH